MSKIEKFYDKNGNAAHYDTDRLNSIIKIERIWGTAATMLFCEITAFKYKERVGKKDTDSIEQELLKANWYENAAKYYFNKIGTDKEIEGLNHHKYGLPWENNNV